MDKEQRKAELDRIKANAANIVMTGIPLNYMGSVSNVNVYKIPLKFLVYNKYNGRISSMVKSFEAQKYELNPEDTAHIKIIEQFLYDSKKDRNDKTMESLRKIGQQKYGIVTSDGYIIDGNRRAFLLNKLYRERENQKLSLQESDSCQYFKAIILDNIGEEKDIQQLETMYQMGEDEKLDYNPIEKYLKCKDLNALGYSDEEIAELMGESKSQVKKWRNTLILMESYLNHNEYDGIYTALEKTEDLFLQLQDALEAYKGRTGNAVTDWVYDDTDISDLKAIAFDYIRARYEGKEFRELIKNGRDYRSIFSNGSIWNTFRVSHVAEIIDDDEPVSETKKRATHDNFVKVFDSRDREWTEKNKDKLKNNLKRHSAKLDDIKDANQPDKLITKALDALSNIDIDDDSFLGCPGIDEKVNEINSLTWNMKQALKKKGKNN